MGNVGSKYSTSNRYAGYGHDTPDNERPNEHRNNARQGGRRDEEEGQQPQKSNRERASKNTQSTRIARKEIKIGYNLDPFAAAKEYATSILAVIKKCQYKENIGPLLGIQFEKNDLMLMKILLCGIDKYSYAEPLPDNQNLRLFTKTSYKAFAENIVHLYKKLKSEDGIKFAEAILANDAKYLSDIKNFVHSHQFFNQEGKNLYATGIPTPNPNPRIINNDSNYAGNAVKWHFHLLGNLKTSLQKHPDKETFYVMFPPDVQDLLAAANCPVERFCDRMLSERGGKFTCYKLNRVMAEKFLKHADVPVKNFCRSNNIPVELLFRPEGNEFDFDESSLENVSYAASNLIELHKNYLAMMFFRHAYADSSDLILRPESVRLLEECGCDIGNIPSKDSKSNLYSVDNDLAKKLFNKVILKSFDDDMNKLDDEELLDDLMGDDVSLDENKNNMGRPVSNKKESEIMYGDTIVGEGISQSYVPNVGLSDMKLHTLSEQKVVTDKVLKSLEQIISSYDPPTQGNVRAPTGITKDDHEILDSLQLSPQDFLEFDSDTNAYTITVGDAPEYERFIRKMLGKEDE